MNSGLVIAAAERAGDHAVLLGIVVLIAAVGALVYGLLRLVGKIRAGRARSDGGPEDAREPEA